MRIISTIMAAACCLLSVHSFASNVFSVSTPGISVVVKAEPGKEAKIVYFGPKIEAEEGEYLARTTGLSAYPAFGVNCTSEPALSVIHADGNPSLVLVVDGVAVTSDGSSETLTVTLRDKVYPFSVDLCWKAYSDVDLIEAWSVIRNTGKEPVTLLRFDSACLPIRRDAWIASFSGAWGNETRLTTELLTPGVKIIKNKDGVRNSQTAHAEVMFGLDGCPQENTGAVIGAALCYSGNFQLKVDTDESDWHKFFAGINPDNSQYVLDPGENFETPALALTYSGEGLGGASRNFHDWARRYALAHGDRERKILLNSWEGIRFGLNEQAMDDMMDDIASMDGELFVMDDGWFGEKYPRDKADCGLGDWTVDKKKLPGGLGHLVKSASDRGLGFGIWIEPEMTNTISELYEQHPDWVIGAPLRDPVYGRGGTQLVLDLSNPAVQDHVFSVVDNLMTENPGIEYIKWDANCPIHSVGSQYLPANKQSQLDIEYHHGLVKTLKRIREKYPDLTIQACAGGGGRATYGILPWADEFWVSDNTDALQRIYIQWGTSYFYPAIAMACHISESPNQQTSRLVPLKYRIDVAMSGRLGMEIQPKIMTDEEKEQCRKAIGEYKEIRPVVQFGDIYRLVSPYDGQNVASLMYCSKDKSKAVFYWWKLEHFVNMHLPKVKMAGLDPDRHYRVRELDRIDTKPLSFEGQTFSGAFLMNTGLEIPYTHTTDAAHKTDWASRVLYLEAID